MALKRKVKRKGKSAGRTPLAKEVGKHSGPSGRPIRRDRRDEAPLMPPKGTEHVDSMYQKHEVWSQHEDRADPRIGDKAAREAAKPRWTLEQIIQILQDKILQRKGGPMFQMRNLFGVSGQSFKPLKAEDLQLKMKVLGLHMTKAQCAELFTALDVSGKGELGMNDFLSGLLPKVRQRTAPTLTPRLAPPLSC